MYTRGDCTCITAHQWNLINVIHIYRYNELILHANSGTVYVNKMSPYSNSNYLSSIVSIV